MSDINRFDHNYPLLLTFILRQQHGNVISVALRPTHPQVDVADARQSCHDEPETQRKATR
ncbi:hypothetical protein RP75_22180 [Agrobacterium arsenijevicii]|uniref:Uncharacterized protein n=1 Tax=Agrobacterium arsenijevicii TaxID=1585697 RepID=A0ABR5D285_9HYPH|nr:hypothetical protein RP75_22180 [Agrobacterium arsenijevicii]